MAREKAKLELDLRVEQNQLISNAEAFVTASRELLFNKYNYYVQDSNYAQAKNDRATINKFIDNIKAKRIETEKDFLAVFQPTKELLMQLEKDAKQLADGLGEGIKTVDNYEKEDKKNTILSFYEDIQVYEIPFEKVFDEKWLNKSCREHTWQSELTAKVEKIKKDVDYITDCKCEDEYVFLASYLETFDIPSAKARYDAYISSKHKSQSIIKDNGFEQSSSVGVTTTPAKEENRSEAISQAVQSEVITTIVELQGTKEELDALLAHINTKTTIRVRPFRG